MPTEDGEIFNPGVRAPEAFVVHSCSIHTPIRFGVGYTTRNEGRRALREAVRVSANECRRRYQRAGVIKRSADSYEIRVGGRQGYHLWECLILTQAGRTPVLRVETQFAAEAKG